VLDGMIRTGRTLSEEDSACMEEAVSFWEYLLAGWLEWDPGSVQLQ